MAAPQSMSAWWESVTEDSTAEYASRNNYNILRFLKQVYLDGVQLFTFKLLLVGEGGGGKTQLANQLRGAPFAEGASMTNGIATSQVQLEGAGGARLVSYVWDCGGQEPFQHTHSIFFTQRRTVFAAVYNLRLAQGCALLHSYLHAVHAYAPTAPVLLVGTHLDQGTGEDAAAVADLKKRFPQIVGTTVAVSSLDDTNMDVLRAAVVPLATAPM